MEQVELYADKPVGEIENFGWMTTFAKMVMTGVCHPVGEQELWSMSPGGTKSWGAASRKLQTSQGAGFVVTREDGVAHM